MCHFAIGTLCKIELLSRNTVWRGCHGGPSEKTRVREALFEVYDQIETSVRVSECRRVFPCTFLMPMTRTVHCPCLTWLHLVAIGLRFVKRSGSDQISRDCRRRANGIRSRLSSNWRWITAIGGSTEDELAEFVVVSDRSGRSSAVVGFVCAVANRKRGWQWPQCLTALHHFLDTVLPKKRVTRRLAAATAVAQPHDMSDPARLAFESEIWPQGGKAQWQRSEWSRGRSVGSGKRDLASGW